MTPFTYIALGILGINILIAIVALIRLNQAQEEALRSLERLGKRLERARQEMGEYVAKG